MRAPHRTEIDHRVLKPMVGLTGLFLATTSLLSGGAILSISQSH